MGLLESGACVRAVAAAACGLALASAAAAQEPVLVVVTSILDGDSIKVQLPDGPVTVRLRNIDAPEMNQPGGGAATRALNGRLLGQEVSLHDVTRDDEQRWVAVVRLGDENINGWMVKQGHAWAYRGQTRESDYCVWENAARSLKRGLWADKYWTSPWDWRTSQRDSLFFVTDYSNATTAGCMRATSDTPVFDD
ncbi:MAG TPA: thermonuclease family protein [Steroidobacteraceae bacterium]|nr:thermonuclease family protein [Steroidobacteraceae bacterium]